ncbi:MAG: Epoxyqueuosine reductase [Chloroflexi bacterium ADurb.Bin325]|nr:MAG: Epoxyqueuosine reductase [Chloroflexi bacterium ADurb.Bin325]
MTPTEILTYALSLGFDMVATVPVAAPRYSAEFTAWLRAGYHGEMAYLAERAALRLAPAQLLDDARTMIVLAANYNPGPPPPGWDDPARGRIARYAWAPDYHDVIKPRLYALDAFIRQRTGRETLGKACVDTAPLLERDFAEQAGLGFIGRNTCLIAPGLGSWTFLAALLVPEDLERAIAFASDEQPNEQQTRTNPASSFRLPASGFQLPAFVGCGACTRCLTACPTRAFAGPHSLDARRCISYLTIELRGPIPVELRPLMGNWVFGCDVCQAVCPYNRAAPSAQRLTFVTDLERVAPRLADLLALDDAAFRARFRGTPLMRAKRRGLVRNACVAAGNSDDASLIPALAPLLEDAEPLVREHAAWALARLEGHAPRG